MRFWIGLLSLGICIVLMGHIFFSHRPRAPDSVSMRWHIIAIRSLVEGLALYWWLSVMIPLLGWMLVFGDNGDWFYDWSWTFAAAIALTSAILSGRRLLAGKASRLYARIHLWVPIALIALFASLKAARFVSHIDGFTAEEAARTAMHRIEPYIEEPVQLVEDRKGSPSGHNPERCRTYWMMGPEEPRGWITVCRHGYFFWSKASHRRFGPSEERIREALERLRGPPMDRETAVRILQNVVRNYPNTPAEERARGLLRALEAEIPQGFDLPQDP